MSRTGWLVFAGLGCGGLVVVLVLCAGGGVMLFRAGTAVNAEISAEVDSLLAAAQTGDFADTYASNTTPELRKAITEDEYPQLGDMIARLGPLKTKSVTRFNINQKNALTIADFSYRAQFEHGPATINVKFQKVLGSWKLLTLNVNSPVFSQDIASEKCPACGKLYSRNAKFCPHCGKAIRVKAEAESPASAN